MPPSGFNTNSTFGAHWTPPPLPPKKARDKMIWETRPRSRRLGSVDTIIFCGRTQIPLRTSGGFLAHPAKVDRSGATYRFQ